MTKYFLFFLIIFTVTTCKPPESVLNGYVEGEYIYISPTTSGVLKDIFVQRGQNVKSGQALFSIDDAELKASVTYAKAEVMQVQAQLENLLKGGRSEEIEVIIKKQDQAKALLENVQKEYKRAQQLIKSAAISYSKYDRYKSEYKTAKANVEELSAQLKVAGLEAREDEITAAQATLEMAKQKHIQVQKQLQDSVPKALAESYVENTFFSPGEYVAAGRAVISLLPIENVKIRFFIPQNILATVAVNQNITINCDSCIEPISAKISYISSQAEYTPPIIYSNDSRQKLVFMVEAIPDQALSMLRPGLPVDIEIARP
ncbi:MAG: HlyD family secretion protein [Rickettsiaceae bacterium]